MLVNVTVIMLVNVNVIIKLYGDKYMNCNCHRNSTECKTNANNIEACITHSNESGGCITHTDILTNEDGSPVCVGHTTQVDANLN